MTLSSIHSSLPSTATQHRIYSVETTLIKICHNLFLLQQPPLLPCLPCVECHFQHRKQLLVSTGSTESSLDKNQDFCFTDIFTIFFRSRMKKKYISCQTDSPNKILVSQLKFGFHKSKFLSSLPVTNS